MADLDHLKAAKDGLAFMRENAAATVDANATVQATATLALAHAVIALVERLDRMQDGPSAPAELMR